jgi:hypothetical protein
MQLATTVAAQVSPPPPPGTDPAAYLAAVLAVRRDREQARLFARQAAAQQGFAAYAPPGAQPFPASPAPGGTPAPQGQPGPAPAHGPTPRTLPLGPDEMITLAKQDQPEDHGFAAPT